MMVVRYAFEVCRYDTLKIRHRFEPHSHVESYRWRWLANACRILYLLYGKFPDGVIYLPGPVYEVCE